MRLQLTSSCVVGGRPTRPFPNQAPILVAPFAPVATAVRQFRLLAGLIPPDGTFRATCIEDPEVVAALDAFGATDTPPSIEEKIFLAGRLSPLLRSPAIAALLGHRDPAEVWRWAALGRAHPKLREAILAGRLSPTHARPLLALPASAQADWTTRALRGRWSVSQLSTAVRQDARGLPAPSSADIRALEAQLGERLGTTVRVTWPEDPAAQRRLTIDWFDVESLKGILSQLAAGPELSETAQPRARQLTLVLQNADELGALTQHLLAEA